MKLSPVQSLGSHFKGGLAPSTGAKNVLAFVFLGIPVWWLVGLQHLIWLLIGLVFATSAVKTGRTSWPPLFGLWLLFLFWFAISGLSIESNRAWMSYLFRAAVYWSVTIFLVKVWLDLKTGRLERTWLLAMVAGFSSIVVLCGLVGLILPGRSWLSPVGRLIPGFLNDVKFVLDITTTQTSQMSNFLGTSVPRPTAPFTYTNQWGSIFVLTVPFAFAWAREGGGSPIIKRLLHTALSIGLVPLIFSLSRGAWLALLFGVSYYFLRVMRRSNQGRLASLVGLVFVGILVLGSPLRGLVEERLATPHSNQGRLDLYEASLDLALESPVIGHGSPVLDQADPHSPSAGTHGQFWLVLVSQGFVGVVVFYSFFLAMIWTTRRWVSEIELMMHIVLVIGLIESLYYELLPVDLFLIVAAFAIARNSLDSRRLRGVISEQPAV